MKMKILCQKIEINYLGETRNFIIDFSFFFIMFGQNNEDGWRFQIERVFINLRL